MACRFTLDSGHCGLVLVPTFAFHSVEKLDRADVNSWEAAHLSDRTTSVMFPGALAKPSFHGASADHCRILPRNMSASTARGMFSTKPGCTFGRRKTTAIA
jgi:hypothetical protein